MTKPVRITIAGLTLSLTVLGILLAFASVSGTSLLRINSHDTEFVDVKATIKANKDECDRKIEEIQKQSIEQTRVMTEVQTDVKWIKQALENDGN